MHWTDGERLAWSRVTSPTWDEIGWVIGAKGLSCAALGCLWCSWRAQARLGVCSHLKVLEMWWPGIPRWCSPWHWLGRKVGSCCTWRGHLEIQQISSYYGPWLWEPVSCHIRTDQCFSGVHAVWTDHIIQQPALSSIQGRMLWGKRQSHGQIWLSPLTTFPHCCVLSCLATFTNSSICHRVFY